MCTYNGARFLCEQLDSIALQSRVPDEMVICDDSSVDKTLSILKDFAEVVNFPVKIQYNASRLGVVENFHQAISFSQGDVIVLSDQDDIWKHNKLEVIEQVLGENPDAAYAFSDAIVINEGGEVIHQSLWQQVSFDRRGRAIFSLGALDQARTLLKRNVVTGATMAFRASLKARVLPVPEPWVHDEWIAFAASLYGAYGIPIPEPLTYYRQHAAQAIGIQQALWRRAWDNFCGNLKVSEAHAREFNKWKALYTRHRATKCLAPNMLALLKAKQAHVALRTNLLQRTRLARIPSIAAELKRKQYHLYSNGWNSAIRDLLTPALGDGPSPRRPIR
jgi:glycosyltransferase involved in cell wall biosynthesis